MSLHLIGAAWEHGPKDPARRVLLMAYAEHADARTGECWPSNRRLSEITGMSDRTIRRQRAALAAEGWIKINGDRRRNKKGLLTTDLVVLVLSRIGLLASGQNVRSSGQNDRKPAVKMTGRQSSGQNDRTGTPLRTKGAGAGTRDPQKFTEWISAASGQSFEAWQAAQAENREQVASGASDDR